MDLRSPRGSILTKYVRAATDISCALFGGMSLSVMRNTRLTDVLGALTSPRESMSEVTHSEKYLQRTLGEIFPCNS